MVIVGDKDPLSEGGDLGATPADDDGRGGLRNMRGSFIYVESNRESPFGSTTCLTRSAAHETGHQFGLGHPTATRKGIMAPSCPDQTDLRFIDSQLKLIRQRLHPQDVYVPNRSFFVP
jgi:hypothetical protein